MTVYGTTGILAILITCVYVYIHACMYVHVTAYGTTESFAILIVVSQELVNTFLRQIGSHFVFHKTSYGSFCHKTWIWEGMEYGEQ